MNKYQKLSKARLSANLRDPLDVYREAHEQIGFDEVHKESVEDRAKRLMAVCSVAVNMFELLLNADLPSDGRTTALQLLNVLYNRMGEK